MKKETIFAITLGIIGLIVIVWDTKSAEIECPNGIASVSEMRQIVSDTNGTVLDVFTNEEINSCLAGTNKRTITFEFTFVEAYYEDGADTTFVAYYNENGCNVANQILPLSMVKETRDCLKGI